MKRIYQRKHFNNQWKHWAAMDKYTDSYFYKNCSVIADISLRQPYVLNIIQSYTKYVDFVYISFEMHMIIDQTKYRSLYMGDIKECLCLGWL